MAEPDRQALLTALTYGRAINRIRSYYLEVADDHANLFMLSGHDDAPGVLSNMAIRPSPWQSFFTMASMVAVINSVVGGSAIALAVGAASEAPLGICAGIGGAFALVFLVALRRHETSVFEAGAPEHAEALFPTPPEAEPGGARPGR